MCNRAAIAPNVARTRNETVTRSIVNQLTRNNRKTCWQAWRERETRENGMGSPPPHQIRRERDYKRDYQESPCRTQSLSYSLALHSWRAKHGSRRTAELGDECLGSPWGDSRQTSGHQ